MSILFFNSIAALAFENYFALNTNAAQIFIGGFNIGLEYNANNLPFNIEIFSSSSRERPGNDMIAQKYSGIKLSYNVSGLSAFEDGFLIRSGVENVNLDYYWDNKSDCIWGCPGNNYRSKTGSTQFTRYNLGLGLQVKSKSNLDLFGRENFILYKIVIEKNFSDRKEIDVTDRNGNPLKEKIPNFNNYSLFISVGLIF